MMYSICFPVRVVVYAPEEGQELKMTKCVGYVNNMGTCLSIVTCSVTLLQLRLFSYARSHTLSLCTQLEMQHAEL